MAYKPQTPITDGQRYIYPITSADQVIVDENGSRLLKDGVVVAGDSDKLGGIPPSEYMLKREMIYPGVEIVPTVSGSVIALDDASNLPLRGLILHGKTTQDGTPSPDNPVELDSAENPTVCLTGKNLWSLGDITGTAGNNVLEKADLILPAGTYTISAVVSYLGEIKDWTIGFADKNGSSITSVTFANGVIFTLSRPSATVTLYARCEATFSRIQIEHGRIATGYEPYSGQNLVFSDVISLPGIPVTSGGNYTDQNGQQWICDEIDLERGVKTVRTKQFALSNVESWNPWMGHWYNHNYIQDSISTYNAIIGLCSHAISEGKYILTSTICHSDIINDHGIGIQISNAATLWGFTGATAAEFKAFIDAKNVKLVYACIPEEVKLTEDELSSYRALVTNKPNTTIYNDAGCDQTIKYAIANPDAYINELMSNGQKISEDELTVHSDTSDMSMDSEKLGGKAPSEYLGKNEQAADSEKLGGKAPEYYLRPRNLLDNSDFMNPILTEDFVIGEASTSHEYLFKRWRVVINKTATVLSIDSTGATFESGSSIEQRLYGVGAGTPITFAVCLGDNAIHVVSGICQYDASGYKIIADNTDDSLLDFWINTRLVDSVNCVEATIACKNGNRTIKWAALYEGSYTAENLPPYVPKGYANELLACEVAEKGDIFGMDLLWENASPSSSFLSGTEIALAQGYSEYMLIVTGNYAKRIAPVIFRIGEPVAMSFVWGDDGSMLSRSFDATATGLKANSGYSNKSVNDSVMVPVRVYGMKGVGT